MRLWVVATAILTAIGCSSTPVTFAPYAGMGGGPEQQEQWHAGIGASFTLGGVKPVVTPVPGHASLPSVIRVDNSNSNSNSADQSQYQDQTQGQHQHVSGHHGHCKYCDD
jgi:hypothetical protein